MDDLKKVECTVIVYSYRVIEKYPRVDTRGFHQNQLFEKAKCYSHYNVKLNKAEYRWC